MQLIKFSTNKQKIVIAVSGGVDSVAMLVLLSEWAKANEAQIIVLTVNHNVRKESREECQYVKNLSNKLGHECHILDWYPNINLSNFQERARDARYNLMTKFCQYFGLAILVTGHHSDDLLEDYFFTSIKKGQLLAHSTNNIRYYNDIRIIKPAFNIKKKFFRNFLISQKIDWYEDISNQSNKYSRNRIRHYLMEQGEEFKKKSVTLMKKKKFAATKIHQELIQAIAETIKINNYGFAKINLNLFNHFSVETKLNVLNYVLTIISGSTRIPRSKSTSLIVQLLDKPDDFIKTLHDCVISKTAENLLIYYELGKNNSPTFWKQRFTHITNHSEYQQFSVSTLTINDYTIIKGKINLQNLKAIAGKSYKKILFTLPVIKILEKVVALPHISYCDYNIFEQDHFIFSPKFVSRFTHFC